jgi:hypothetical protein
MSNDRDIIARAAFHESHPGIAPGAALERARRELDLGAYWTPWELLGSAHALDYLERYIATTLTTRQ